MLYGMIGKEVNGRICGGWFPIYIYIYIKLCLFARYCQIKKIYGVVGFVCRPYLSSCIYSSLNLMFVRFF